MGKEVKVLWGFDYMHKNKVCSHVDFLSNLTFKVENYTNDLLETAFGLMEDRSYSALVEFFETRCCPKTRSGIEDILKNFGLEHFSAIDIVRQTHGVMTDDFHWVRFDNESNLTFEEVYAPLIAEGHGV